MRAKVIASILDYPDLWFAAGLLLIVLVVFIASRIGTLSSRNPAVVIGAVLGALGITWFVWFRRKAANARVQELEARIESRKKRMKALEPQMDAAQKEVDAATAALENQVGAAKVELARIEEKLDAEIAAARAASPTELATGFARQLREEQAYQERIRANQPVRVP
jgi:outer membrane murein-binding lipoprotein Lpp